MSKSNTIYFRNEPLIDRVKELDFITSYYEKQPKRILWIYGPKSTGKTTLIEYIVENKLFDDFALFKSKKYNVKYIITPPTNNLNNQAAYLTLSF